MRDTTEFDAILWDFMPSMVLLWGNGGYDPHLFLFCSSGICSDNPVDKFVGAANLQRLGQAHRDSFNLPLPVTMARPLTLLVGHFVGGGGFARCSANLGQRVNRFGGSRVGDRLIGGRRIDAPVGIGAPISTSTNTNASPVSPMRTRCTRSFASVFASIPIAIRRTYAPFRRNAIPSLDAAHLKSE